MSIAAGAPVLEMRGVEVAIETRDGARRRITYGVDLALHRGRTVALVGESGCGKSVTGLAAMNLLTPPLRLASGRIHLATEQCRPVQRAGAHLPAPAAQSQHGRYPRSGSPL